MTKQIVLITGRNGSLAKHLTKFLKTKYIVRSLTSNKKSELGLISIFKDYTENIGFKIKKKSKEKDSYEIFTNIQIEDKQLILN